MVAVFRDTLGPNPGSIVTGTRESIRSHIMIQNSISTIGRLIILGTIGLLGGCQKDDVESYDAPKSAAIDLGGRTRGPKQRVLAVLIPRGQQTWFFKLQAPDADVAVYKDEFDRLLQTIHFSDRTEAPIEWTTPAGWRQEAGNQMRFATLRPESKEHPVELTVTNLPGDASNVLANVNRWRGQLSLPPVAEADLPKVTKEIKIDGSTATVVDFSGYATGSGKMAPFAGHPPIGSFGQGQPETGRPNIYYTKPEAWVPLPADKSGIRFAGFQVTEGDRSAQITITPLSAQSGSLLDNVNRWRAQVGMAEIGEEQMRRDLREIELAGTRCPYVDLLGPESATPGRLRMLVAVATRGDRTWYFKIVGNPDLVSQQEPSFEAFLHSVRFDGGTS
jgi:hypothetical protein